MQALTALPNIGKNLALQLQQCGIETPDQLEDLGAEQAFIQLVALDENACLSKLCALEGAIRGARWHHLPPERKEELKVFFRMVKKRG